MFIKRIYSFDEDSGEADLIVSDGIYDVLCFCSLFQNELKIMSKIKEVETFMCDDIMRVVDENHTDGFIAPLVNLNDLSE